MALRALRGRHDTDGTGPGLPAGIVHRRPAAPPALGQPLPPAARTVARLATSAAPPASVAAVLMALDSLNSARGRHPSIEPSPATALPTSRVRS
jgi:hypothetical protein